MRACLRAGQCNAIREAVAECDASRSCSLARSLARSRTDSVLITFQNRITDHISKQNHACAPCCETHSRLAVALCPLRPARVSCAGADWHAALAMPRSLAREVRARVTSRRIASLAPRLARLRACVRPPSLACAFCAVLCRERSSLERPRGMSRSRAPVLALARSGSLSRSLAHFKKASPPPPPSRLALCARPRPCSRLARSRCLPSRLRLHAASCARLVCVRVFFY
jgi:hypothetical protein